MEPEIMLPPWSGEGSKGEYFAVPYSMLPAQIKARRQMEGLPGDGLEFKSLPFKELKADGDRRVLLWIARMGDDYVDDGGDMILKGAFDKTINDDGPGGQNLIKYFHDHSLLLGPAVEVDAKKDGVQMLGQIDEDALLDKYYEHAKSGAVAHGSFGYNIKEAHRDTFKGRPIRVIAELKCWEGSQVVWPMNRAATVLDVKAARVSGVHAHLAKGVQITDTDRKSLYGASWIIQALAEIDECYSRIARLLADEDCWGTLCPEDRALIDSYLDQMCGTTAEVEGKRSGRITPPSANPEAFAAADRLLTLMQEAKKALAA